MINFKEEIQKYCQILEVNDIEDSIHSTELKDIMDMLGYIAKNQNQDLNKTTGRRTS